MSPSGLAHWDDVKPSAGELGHLGGTWRDLGRAAGSVRVGVKRIEIAAGKWSTPVHTQGAEEEVFYVLGGSGLSWQDGAVYEIAEGDLHRAPAPGAPTRCERSLDGLDVLAFGTRVPIELGYLPRAGVGWLSPRWVEVDKEPGPWQREVELGEPEVPEPSPRPANIVNLTDAPTKFGGLMRGLASKLVPRRRAQSPRPAARWHRRSSACALVRRGDLHRARGHGPLRGLAVHVGESLDPRHHADAPQVDLVRARVVAMSFGSRVP